MVTAMFAVALAVATALPSVGEVHALFVDALGGERAVLRPQYVTTYGRYDVYGSDGKVKRVSFVRYGAAGFRQLEIDRSPNGRVSRTGFNTGVGWAVSPYPHGRAQVATGDFLQSARRDADIYYWGISRATFSRRRSSASNASRATTATTCGVLRVGETKTISISIGRRGCSSDTPFISGMRPIPGAKQHSRARSLTSIEISTGCSRRCGTL